MPAARDATPKVWTVSELNQVIKELLEQTFLPFWLAGEISNLTIHRSGHVYFTLKDGRSQIGAVFFNGAGVARALHLVEGMAVEVHGRLTVYEPQGKYQIAVRQVRPKGVGSLQQQFDALKEKLRAAGLFDSARKRPIPALPTCVGVVTSPQGAALHDFLQIIGRRFRGMHVRVYPARVQGEGAAAEVVAGLEYFNRERACDVLVVTRGGGSLEDLWVFNEERVARAVAASEIPVISAIGHEVDFTICDFVADLRAPTPSAAAELVVRQHSEFLERIIEYRRRLDAGVRLQLSLLRGRVERAAGHYILREPMNLVRRHQQRVDELALRLEHALTRRRDHARDRLARLDAQLRLLDPRQVLTRGYAIVLGERDGRAWTDSAQAAPGDRAKVVLARGELRVEVRETRPAG